MNEDVFNTTIRKFLKQVGVNSQRAIEVAVRDAIAKGKLKGAEALPATVTLKVGGVDLSLEIEGTIELQ
ncbi:MAG: DUF6494 family protein [Pseudorhodoplanes sp.]